MEFRSLNLLAKTRNEELVKHYLEENASAELARKINEGVQITIKDGDKTVTVINKKTLSGFWTYATAEAKKRAQNGCAAIEDEVVFGWAIHYFEEASIHGDLYNLDGTRYDKKPAKGESKSKQEAPKKPAEPTKPANGQMSLFDAFAGDTEASNDADEAESADEQEEGEEDDVEDEDNE